MAQLTRSPLRIRDIAERARVSQATVSRVITGSATVTEVKGSQVLAVIDEPGYRPNRVASNLRRQQVHMIGIVVSDIENAHFTQMVRAAEDAAYMRAHRVLLCNADEDPEKRRAYLGARAAKRVAGAMIFPTNANADDISGLIDLGTCVVSFDRAVADRRADAILWANLEGARLGTDHLLSGGHESLGFIAGPAGIRTTHEGFRRYEQAMCSAGLPLRVSQGDLRARGGRKAAEELIQGGATALLVANYPMAVGMLRAIRGMGGRVGTDIAVVSFDDPPWAALIDPPLTTLAQPVRAMADAAAELLLQRLDGTRKRRKRKVFEFELRHRSSCCPAWSPQVNLANKHALVAR